MERELPKSYGVHMAVEVKTDTRPFDVVEAAAHKAQINPERLPQRPGTFQAISRAIACLMRVCMSSIEFPAWSKHNSWEEERVTYRVVKGARIRVTGKVACSGRNPNYSLKITQVKRAAPDAATTWRLNIANRNNAGENMGHVLSVTYDPTLGVYFDKGVDAAAFAEFGKELQHIVNEEYKRFANNYNDEDIRTLISAELADMHALSIIKRNNAFIPHTMMERAKALYTFAKDCGQEVSWLGLDNSPETRDSLLADLKTAVFSAMDEYEKELDEKLNPTGLERKRGEKRREQMHDTAMANIDKIMAQAQYHAQVLGVMAEAITEREKGLRAKAFKLLTTTGDETPALVASGTPTGAQVVKPGEDAFA